MLRLILEVFSHCDLVLIIIETVNENNIDNDILNTLIEYEIPQYVYREKMFIGCQRRSRSARVTAQLEQRPLFQSIYFIYLRMEMYKKKSRN